MKAVMCFVLVLRALSAAGDVIQTKLGQSVTIPCGVKVNTFRKNLVWNHKDDLILNIPTSGFPRKGKSAIVARSKVPVTDLQISGVTEEDAGRFVCVADGTSHEHTLLVVSVSLTPPGALELGGEASLQCRVAGLSAAPQWKKPDGGPAGSATVLLKPVGPEHAGTWTCTFSADGQTYSEDMDIKIKESTTTKSPAKDIHALSGVTCTTTTAGPPLGRTQLLGLQWWVWVALGCGSLVIVLLMILIIVLYKRIRRKKQQRRLLQMKKTRGPENPRPYCQCQRPTAAAKAQRGRRREKPSALPLQPLLLE